MSKVPSNDPSHQGYLWHQGMSQTTPKNVNGVHNASQ
jgi:hypothetical protein